MAFELLDFRVIMKGAQKATKIKFRYNPTIWKVVYRFKQG